mmetsp:Transcript_56980/g.146660  ORF Transcript_56980/g.146660 Transcript_56980/m.146660 type:complete len:202 (-) Transcript_56980:980-1585(-)
MLQAHVRALQLHRERRQRGATAARAGKRARAFRRRCRRRTHRCADPGTPLRIARPRLCAWLMEVLVGGCATIGVRGSLFDLRSHSAKSLNHLDVDPASLENDGRHREDNQEEGRWYCPEVEPVPVFEQGVHDQYGEDVCEGQDQKPRNSVHFLRDEASEPLFEEHDHNDAALPPAPLPEPVLVHWNPHPARAPGDHRVHAW